MELTNEQKERQRLQMHELPIECDYSDGEEYCGEMLHFEKKFYIVELYHEFLPEAKRKGKWDFYRGFCKAHFKEGLKHERYSIRWHNRNKKTKNPQKAKIIHIWKVTEVKA